MRSVALPLLLLLFSSQALGFHIEANAFYFGDTFVADTNSTGTYSAYDASLNIDLTKKGGVTIGWSYMMVDSQQKLGSEYKYTTSEMGPRLGFFLDKEKNWSIGAAYHLVGSAKYEAPGLSNVTWKGTSLKADLGYGATFSESFRMGFKLNYYSSTWAEQLVNDSDYSKIAYTRSWIYPSIQFRLHFD